MSFLEWESTAKFIVQGLMLAALVGVAALAFKDWQAYQRLVTRFIALLAVAWGVGGVTAIYFYDQNYQTIMDGVYELAEAGEALPKEISEAAKQNIKIGNYLISYALLPTIVVVLYLGVFYLFAMPPRQNKPDQEEIEHVEAESTDSEENEIVETGNIENEDVKA